MKKRKWNLLMCGILAAVMLTGCGETAKPDMGEKESAVSDTVTTESKAAETENGTTDVEEETKLEGKLVMMTNSSGGTYEAVEAIVQEFMELHPGVEIEFSSQGSDYESLMKAKMAANDLPDVFATHGWSVNRYSEYLIPLNDQGWYDELSDEIIPVISDKEGNIYTLPLNVDKAGIIYNTEILKETGHEIPQNWDEFLACCEAAKNAGYTPVYLAGKDEGKIAGVLNILLNSWLASDEEDNEVESLKSGDITADIFVPVFDFVTVLKEKEYFNVDYVTADATTIPEKLASGQVLFALESNSTMADAYALNEDAALAMMPIPTLSGNAAPFLTGGEKEAYGVWKDSENKELALALLNFMAQPENIERVSAGSGMPVSMKNAKSDLGKIQESYDRFGDVRVLNKFDRECFPNGMWSTMKTVGAALVAGDIDSSKAAEMFYTDYENFMSQNN